MSRRTTSFSGQFAGRLVEMLESPAFRVLSLSAHRVIHRIEIELAHHGGKDNGRLPVTFDDFERYGVHRHSISPAIREAGALGFIEITRLGRAGNADWRKPNLFRLTYRPAKGVYGDGTHEWRKITSEYDASTIAAAARKPARKAEDRCRKMPNLGPAKRTEKQHFHGAEMGDTGNGSESITTLDISGRGTSKPTHPPAPSDTK